MKKIILFFCCISAFFGYAQKGYEIKINLKNCKDTIAYLTYYQFDKTMIKDTCKQIKNGKIVFKGKEKLETGIYSLISQDKRIYFDFFIDDATQNLDLKSDETSNFYNDIEASNSKLENDFYNYVRFISSKNTLLTDEIKKTKGKSKKDSLEIITKQQKLISQDINQYEENFILQNKNSFIADAINLKKEKLLKDIPKASNGRPDSIAVFKYYKKHYWDNVNFNDEALIRTPFYASKLKTYFENVVDKHPDSVSVEIDRFLSKINSNSLTFKILLAHFTYTAETSKIMSYDKVFVHISDAYFKTGKAIGVYDDDVIAKIIKQTDKLRPLLIDQIAPSLSMIKASDRPKIAQMGFETAKTSEEVTQLYYQNKKEIEEMFVNLNDVKAAYTILVFWDVDCSHCQVEIPKLLTEYHKLMKEYDLKVYAVYTLNEGEKYLKYIDEKKLDWINVYDGVHYNNIADKYDIVSTPVIYILDKNKVIKAKKIGVEQIETILKNLTTLEKK